MDPDKNLEEQLRLAKILIALEEGSLDQLRGKEITIPALADWGIRLAQIVEALHNWIVKGGFLPRAWQRPDIKRGAFEEALYLTLELHQCNTLGLENDKTEEIRSKLEECWGWTSSPPSLNKEQRYLLVKVSEELQKKDKE